MADQKPSELRQELRGWQVFMIALSAVVGTGILHGDSEALEVAGPWGMLLAFVLVAITTICVMEPISKLIQMFPAPNAYVEYVKAFVDEDWAWVVGVAYWYTYASFFATQLVFAASFAKYWHFEPILKSIVFYAVAPIILLIINTAGVQYFGWIETFGGILKIMFVLGTAIFLFFLDRKEHIGSEYIDDGFQANPSFASNKAIAACYVIPMLLYSFLGVEVVGVTAYEARDVGSLRIPANNIGYIIFALYLLAIVGELLTVSWLDGSLPQIYGAVHDDVNPDVRTRTIISIAALQANYPSISGLFNGCLLYSSLSAANTNLYIASRTLYGLARTPPFKHIPMVRALGSVWPQNAVPMFALFFSAIAFMWLPVLQGAFNYSTATLTEIMNVTASLSCLIVWASLCLAFVRYHAWVSRCKLAIEERYPLNDDPANFNFRATNAATHTYLGALQPWPAYVGLVMCSAIVLIFTSAAWWSTPATIEEVTVAYGPLIIYLTLFAASKVVTHRSYVKLDADCEKLFRVLEHLGYIKPVDAQRKRDLASQGVQA